MAVLHQAPAGTLSRHTGPATGLTLWRYHGWQIEVYFRVLKGGCRVEELPFERQDRFEVCLAVYLIVAWRVLHLLMLGRECPQVSGEAALSAAAWRSVYTIVTGRAAPRTPPLGEMVVPIARLGGDLNRKHDGPPGPQALWIGLQRLRDFAIAWSRFGPPHQREDV
jgi:Transposase Tn5 dimerisation domain